jgi:hypothetical protein
VEILARTTMTDWRLQGQEAFLSRIPLRWSKYAPRGGDGWDHDHCEFCSRKLSLQSDDLHEGYTTLDHYHWVCADCFRDFKEMFGWTVVDS